MRVDAIALRLRPRTMHEACDLGARLVQANARSVWRCYAPPWAAATLLALSTLDMAPWMPMLVLFMAKPWLDRTLLFVLSRAVFGESTRWSDLWAAKLQVWLQGLPGALTLRRLSPWRAYVQPVLQLEGQRGAALRARCRTLLGHHRGQALTVQAVFGTVETIFLASLFALCAWMVPGPGRGSLFAWLTQDSRPGPGWLALGYAAVVLLLEPYFVAAGFGMYLNRRVALEAWDVERQFRHEFET